MAAEQKLPTGNLPERRFCNIRVTQSSVSDPLMFTIVCTSDSKLMTHWDYVAVEMYKKPVLL
jgi:hypothetical protein